MQDITNHYSQKSGSNFTQQHEYNEINKKKKIEKYNLTISVLIIYIELPNLFTVR